MNICTGVNYAVWDFMSITVQITSAGQNRAITRTKAFSGLNSLPPPHFEGRGNNTGYRLEPAVFNRVVECLQRRREQYFLGRRKITSHQ